MNADNKSAIDRLGNAAARRAGSRRALQWAGGAIIAIAAAALLLPLVQARGPTVGWLLLAAGLVELLAASARRKDEARATMRVAGAITMLAGLIFLLDTLLELYSFVTIVILWLFARGGVLLRAAMNAHGSGRYWALFGGVADLVLGAVLLIGLPIAAFVAHVFGPTPELVSRFAFLLAISFLVTGLSLFALSSREVGGEDEEPSGGA